MNVTAVSPARALGRVVDRHTATLLAAALALAWLIVDPRSPDLAAQVYRVDLFRAAGFALWDNNWYDGHHLPGYSLIFPPLASLLGLRALGVLAALASSALFAQLVRDRFGAGARAATLWFAVAATGDLWIGRLTFALGVSVGLAAALALAREHRVAAGVLAALCAAASPVAGLFLAFAGVAQVVHSRSVARGAPLIAPPLALVLALAVLFPEGGEQPFSHASFLATLAGTIGFLLALPGEQRLLRTAGGLYLAAVVLSLLLITPMGSNVVRLGVLFAGPLLVCATARAGGLRHLGRGRQLVAVLVGLGLAAWTINGPIVQARRGADDPSLSAGYYAPVLRFLADRRPVRVEVPFTRAHWESVYLGDTVPLARGWERQLDVKYNHLFGTTIDRPSYHAWLDANAVGYVALSDAVLDPSSVAEAALIRRGLPYLRLAARLRHWSLYAVRHGRPLAAGPGRLTALTRGGFVLRADRAGTFTVRVRYTPYWAITAGAGCVRPTREGWTSVTATRRGPIAVRARLSLDGALRVDRFCTPHAGDG